MMKKIAAWMLICTLLLGLCPAYALTNEEALEKVSNYLTEVYGYTVEDAEKFFATVEQNKDQWIIYYAHNDHPAWMYSAIYNESTGKVTDAVSPFWVTGQFSGYPGEGVVREGLNSARKNGWFTNWNETSRQALAQYMAEWGISANSVLTEGLSLGTIGAGNALHEYFVSCYGEEMNWTPSLKEWHDAEMESYGLTYTEADVAVTEGIVTYQSLVYNIETEMTRFIGEVPETLRQVFSHSRLEGWTCLCGATVQNAGNRYGHGAAVFEREGERLLIGMKFDMDQGEWKISPISKRALYTDKDIYILPNSASAKNQFTIVYQNGETETERFEVNVGETGDAEETWIDAYIGRYTHMDEATGNGVKIDFGSGVKVTTYENHQKVSEEQAFESVTRTMSMLDIKDFPTTLEGWKKAEKQLIPEGYALTSGVHLRKKTSSRSKDLGEYNAGVLVKVLGTEKGDPDPWFHVQVGLAQGYMSSRYVNEAADADLSYVLNRSLPIAQAKENLKLKSGMSWLAGTVQEVPAGTQMHVLAECDGGWLHVSIPQGELDWQMDIHGTDGYVKEDDVQIAGTPLVLDWME